MTIFVFLGMRLLRSW